MRHAARKPPPPDFVICGLLQLTLFGELQNVAQSFKVSVRSFKFSASSLPVLYRYFMAPRWHKKKTKIRALKKNKKYCLKKNPKSKS